MHLYYFNCDKEGAYICPCVTAAAIRLDFILGPGGPVSVSPVVLNLPGVVGCGMAW